MVHVQHLPLLNYTRISYSLFRIADGARYNIFRENELGSD